MEGFSVIICCHNGATRLPATLAHLIAQEPPMTPWEVVLINNRSTDGTAEVARSCWQNGPAPLRVIDESRPGVRYARERGLAEAKYEFLGFVDDDNWVAHDWVRAAYDIISSDPSLGAVGSIRTPVCEVSPPAWFADFHSLYAVLTDCELEKIQDPLEYLPTAGLCVRRTAWEKLIQNGFRSQLAGSIGKKLQGGEDVELTRALLLSGWKLRIDQRLRLRHFIPGHRLQWMYLRKLQRNYSASDAVLDAYSKHSVSLGPGFRRWLSDRWWYQFGKSVTRMASRPSALTAALLSYGEGRGEILEIEQQFGRALGLLQNSKQYGELRREVRGAVWRCRLDYSEARFEGRPDNTMSTI
jgi:glycosyltransferase involved in cell wall biosynthesis